MRVLIADHDSKQLKALAGALADDFTVDIATSKLSCLAMLDVSEFHVAIVCERLEDGSGLELLSQAGKRWPEVLRIFAIEPDRLPLLAGRLKPFRLFETIPYPIDAEKLRNLLTLALAAEEAHVDTMNVQHIVLEDEAGSAAQQPAAATGNGRAAAPRASAAPARSAPPRKATPAVPNASARTALSAALHAHVAEHGSGTPAPGARAANPQYAAASNSGPAIPGALNRRMGQRRADGERRGTISVSSDSGSFPDIDALAEASEIAQAMRPKLERSSNLFDGGRRTTLLFVAGVGAAAVAAAAMMYGGTGSTDLSSPTAPEATLKSVQPVEPAATDANVAAPAQMSFDTAAAGGTAPMIGRSGAEPPEVVAFVADIESALTADNFARARRLLDMLREVAPDHPRLAFFDALISRGEQTNRVQGEVARAAAGNATRAGDRFGTTPARPTDREIAARRQTSLRTLAPAAPKTSSGSATPERAPASLAPPPSQKPRQAGSVDPPTQVRQTASLGPSVSTRQPASSAAPSAQTREPASTAASSTQSRTASVSSRSAATPASPAAALSSTFSGRTLEDSARAASGSAQPETDGARRTTIVLPVVKDAKVVRQVDPEYPREAMRAGVEGTIDLRFTVTADGKVEDIEVVTADPPLTFDRAAMTALRRWRYEPRREDGVAVDSRTRVRLEFKLEKSDRRR